ncbi:unnamed protein product [Heterosigma akashiwo]
MLVPQTGADASEGIFIQSVFPQFGIGAEISAAKMAAQHNRGLGVMRGLGKYAFAPEAHMTEEHHLATERHRRKLFNQFAYFWDVRRDAPVLLEKSPPNMVYSRFIQKMFSADLDPNAPKDIRKVPIQCHLFPRAPAPALCSSRGTRSPTRWPTSSGPPARG